MGAATGPHACSSGRGPAELLKPESIPDATGYTACSGWRRVGAMFYDSLLLLAIFMLATYPVLLLTAGQAVASGNPFYAGYLLLISYLYFCWQWTHGGQTLGMRAWRIRIVSATATPIRWERATIRFLSSLLSCTALGCGFLWGLFDGRRMTWHDHLSGSLPVNVG